MRLQKGFTLIELVVVITILGILAAFALPRFIDASDQAHRASVDGTASALASAVALARAQWTAQGAPGAIENLEGFGPTPILDMSADGWPTGVSGNTDPNAMSVGECTDIWSALLQANAPRVEAAAGPDVDYLATVDGGNCRYSYQLNGDDDFIRYDPELGEVTTFIN